MTFAVRSVAALCGLVLIGCSPDSFCLDGSVGSDLVVANYLTSYYILPDGPWFQDRAFRGASLSNCGKVATVYGTAGTLSISAAGASSPEQSLDFGAVSAVWSNRCELLAVVTRGESGDRVVIMTGDLAATAEIPVELPQPDDGSPYRRFVVSWSADDRLVAVSTDASRNEFYSPYWPDNLRVVPLCLIIDWAAETITSSQKLHNVYFLGVDSLVGTPPNGAVTETSVAAFNVHRYTLRGGQLLEGGLVPLVGFVVGSHPRSGVFVSVDGEIPISEFDLRHVALRRANGCGCRAVQTGNFGEWVLLAERAPIANLIPEGF